MLLQHGGKETAKKLLSTSNVQTAFTEFYLRWQRDGLKLTVEYLVLQEPWTQLFELSELSTARLRLLDHDMKPEKLPG